MGQHLQTPLVALSVCAVTHAMQEGGCGGREGGCVGGGGETEGEREENTAKRGVWVGGGNRLKRWRG